MEVDRDGRVECLEVFEALILLWKYTDFAAWKRTEIDAYSCQMCLLICAISSLLP